MLLSEIASFPFYWESPMPPFSPRAPLMTHTLRYSLPDNILRQQLRNSVVSLPVVLRGEGFNLGSLAFPLKGTWGLLPGAKVLNKLEQITLST